MVQEVEEKKEEHSSFREKLLEGLFGAKKPEEEKKEVKLGDEVKPKYCPKEGCRLIIDELKGGVEANYYWILRFMETKEDFGLKLSGKTGQVLKLKDMFAAGEASSMWGSIEQRKAIQQEKVSTYLATVGKMTKDMFQIIRELRILDERLAYYKGYNDKSHSASVALKSVWVDLVEGGAKNPGSVTGLASQVGFVILPDLFYRIHPKDVKDVDLLVTGLSKDGINVKVREVLARKLYQFIDWKEKTEKEIADRRNFVLAYLRQHFNTIRMYISWVKPYLRNIKQLEMSRETEDPHLLSTFETNKIEVELLGIRKNYTETTPNGFEIEREFKKYFPCIHIRIKFIALPEMAYQKEYQRGAVHLGRTEIYVKGYVSTMQQIEDYKKKIEEDDIAIMTSLESSLMSMKDEITKYLNESNEKNIPVLKEEVIEVMEKTGVKKEKAVEALKKAGTVDGAILHIKEQKPQEGFLDPFKSIFDGFKEILNIKSEKKKDKLPLKKAEEESEKDKAKSEAGSMAWILYDVYKKSHGYITPL
ncbi:MAG: hypothetical protein AABW58_01480 [Nanoarchaeota archaeon]